MQRVRHANKGCLKNSSGHLFLSHFGTCMCSNVESNLSWTCLVSGLWVSNIPRYFCFAWHCQIVTHSQSRLSLVILQSIASWDPRCDCSLDFQKMYMLHDIWKRVNLTENTWNKGIWYVMLLFQYVSDFIGMHFKYYMRTWIITLMKSGLPVWKISGTHIQIGYMIW